MSNCCCDRECDCCGCQRDDDGMRENIREIREGLRIINRGICEAREAMRDLNRCRRDEVISELCRGKRRSEEGLERLVRNSCLDD